MNTTIDYKKFTEYKNGKITLEQLNEYLAPFGLGYDPEKNIIVDGGAVPCEDVTKINGYGLLDTGTGTVSIRASSLRLPPCSRVSSSPNRFPVSSMPV